MAESRSSLGRLVAVGLVLVLLSLGLSVLLPSLSRSRELAVEQSLRRGKGPDMGPPLQSDKRPGEARPDIPAALVKSFEATIDLKPMLSIGNAVPESIYEAGFKAQLSARAPGKGPARISLPLPPQLISLADMQVLVGGNDTADVAIHDGHLLWTGELPTDEDAPIAITYTAVGKGIYTIEKPNEGTIDTFKTTLTAHNSQIRMTDLSLQPNDFTSSGDGVTYVWNYRKLMVARPIAVDVLGIAGLDRLSELGWLGPISVLLFGLLVSIVALAVQPEKLTGWMLLLIAGCFAAAYPLMYFLQDSLPLTAAMAIAGVGVIAIIAVRSITLFGWRVGVLLGVVLPSAFMALTLVATTRPRLAVQGVVLTLEAIVTLVVAMTFLPRAQKHLMAAIAEREDATPPAPHPQPVAAANPSSAPDPGQPRG